MTDLPPSASRSSSDVLRRVAELFPDDQTFVLALLEDYKDSIASRRTRVQWVIVEASRGDLDRLAYLVDLAKIDYRDVLMYEEP
jgi:hypothetical protein